MPGTRSSTSMPSASWKRRPSSASGARPTTMPICARSSRDAKPISPTTSRSCSRRSPFPPTCAPASPRSNGRWLNSCSRLRSSCYRSRAVGVLALDATTIEIDGRVESVDALQILDPARAISLLGLPALAIPAGADAEGFPVGVQLVGRAGAETDLVAVAQSLHRTRRV